MAKPSLADLLSGTAAGIVSTPAETAGSTSPVAVTTPATGGEPIRRRKPPTESETRAQARRLIVRSFVRAFFTPGDTFMSAAASYRVVSPGVTDATARQEGYRMTHDEDVKEEVTRQLRAIDKAADLDDQWVYDRWRAIANANVFDYMSINADGVADFTGLDPLKLTMEQQLVIEEVRVDPKTGRVTNLKLTNKNQAVANVAKARQMIDGKRDLGMVDLAARITERMNKAAKRIGRIIDHDSGEPV